MYACNITGKESLLPELDRLCTTVRSTHTVPRPGGGQAETTIEVATRSDAGQQKALELMKNTAKMSPSDGM